MSPSGLRVAIAGATGAVGKEMLATLEATKLPVSEIRPLASPRSAGKQVTFRDQAWTVQTLTKDSFEGIDVALFSCGGSRSKEFAPAAAAVGAVVIDNSSAFRMDADVPLVVPEVNPDACADHRGIIANPNCSTIQLMLPLKVLAEAPGLDRVIVSTYQSSSGAGQAGMDELEAGIRAFASGEEPTAKVFPHPLAFDAIPHIGTFQANRYTDEELKLTNESRKILSIPDLDISGTCVRVPVFRCHSESVTVDLRGDFDVAEIQERMDAFPNLVLVDDLERNKYPLARVSEGSNDTYVGRLRRDVNRSRTLHFWLVSDNLLKGAAFNAVQIAEYVVEAGLLRQNR
ncbi:MAG: aspartate-semialdehyde dehydrogenase [Myxococcales bacterium]|nr:aspartate-semialdehyde dehydrogenase [Myxococcales bacterium]